MAEIASVLDGARTELVQDLSWGDYREAVGLNASTIVHGLKSMKHLRHAWDHGRPDSDAMKWGRALHCLLFEPKRFESRYRCWQGRRAGNDYKDFAAQAFLDGAEVLPYEGAYSYGNAVDAACEFFKNDRVRELVRAGVAEATVFSPEGRIQCRGRLDWIATDEEVIVDLKTARSILARPFGRAFYEYGYDVKLGLYQRWLRAVTGKLMPVEVIAIENSPPYDVDVIPIPEAVLDRGARKGLDVIACVERSILSDTWPGGGCGFLDTPSYEMDEELEGAEEVEYGE